MSHDINNVIRRLWWWGLFFIKHLVKEAVSAGSYFYIPHFLYSM